MSYRVSMDFGCDPANVGLARKWLRDSLAGSRPQVDREIIADAEVVISELVTNSVRAACTLLHVHLDHDPECLRLGVTDDAPGLPVVGTAKADALSGRGLPIVDALAAQWGVRPLATGKEIWALFQL